MIPFQYPRLVTPIRLMETGYPAKKNGRCCRKTRQSGSNVAGRTALTKVANHLALSTHLTRIQFDDHRFVDIASDISTVGNLFERSGQLGGIDVHPLRHALASGQIQ